jgi:hypothetical protein
MLQDFNFKILHHHGFKHNDVDAFNHNPVSKIKLTMIFSKKSKMSSWCKSWAYKLGLEERTSKIANYSTCLW